MLPSAFKGLIGLRVTSSAVANSSGLCCLKSLSTQQSSLSLLSAGLWLTVWYRVQVTVLQSCRLNRWTWTGCWQLRRLLVHQYIHGTGTLVSDVPMFSVDKVDLKYNTNIQYENHLWVQYHNLPGGVSRAGDDLVVIQEATAGQVTCQRSKNSFMRDFYISN